jgi:hypothetical protein
MYGLAKQEKFNPDRAPMTARKEDPVYLEKR